MRFSIRQVKDFTECLEKLNRFFAYKYEVPKSEISFIFKDKVIHVLINGKAKEAFKTTSMHEFVITEKTLEITRGNKDGVLVN